MKPANFAPVYCALYPALAEIARKHGYAMAIHGTMARDFDLICIPWVETPSKPEEVVAEITKTYATTDITNPATSLTVARPIPSALGSVSSLLTCRLCPLSRTPTNDQINHNQRAVTRNY